jgi:regulator of replication initiation timing
MSIDVAQDKRNGINAVKRQAVLDVIDRMARELDPALDNVSEIARRAGVHRNYVAKNFTHAIAKAKAEVSKRYAAGQANKTALTIASIRADYENLKQHVGELERENRALRRRLAHQLGEEAAAEDARLDQTPELVAARDERDQLIDRVTELELELENTLQELEATRNTNRRLMRERNLSTP